MNRTIFNFRKPTPAELLAQHLAQTELSLIHATAELEQHTAYVKMLRERRERIRRELVEAAQEEGK
jgi:hypothetical protein